MTRTCPGNKALPGQNILQMWLLLQQNAAHRRPLLPLPVSYSGSSSSTALNPPPAQILIFMLAGLLRIVDRKETSSKIVLKIPFYWESLIKPVKLTACTKHKWWQLICSWTGSCSEEKRKQQNCRTVTVSLLFSKAARNLAGPLQLFNIKHPFRY